MKEFTFEEVIQFIKEQDDSREVNMADCRFSSCVSCVMSQFFKEKGIVFDYVTCEGYKAVGLKDEIVAKITNPPHTDIITFMYKQTYLPWTDFNSYLSQSFGGLKKILKEKHNL